MLLSRIPFAGRFAYRRRWAVAPLSLPVLLLVGLVLAAPARAQGDGAAPVHGGFWDPGPKMTLFFGGWQVGRYAAYGMGNMYYHALRLNRGAEVGSLEKPMTWSETYGGPVLAITRIEQDKIFELRWSNRRTIHSASWTDVSGQAWSTSYRTRLNEVSLGIGKSLLGGRLRPGGSADFGLFRVSRRDGKGSDKGKWGSMHFDDPTDAFFVAPGRMSPTAGLTAFCDVAPLGGRGPSLRVFYQRQLLRADLFGLAGTIDVRDFAYGISNYGLALSWGYSSK